MAQLTIDLSGIGGLSNKYQGDLHSTTSQPNLRYLAGEGQFVGGVYNPFKKYGYISPANKSKVDISGTITTAITSSEYDELNDITYFSEIGAIGTSGSIITKLDGNDDTSLSNLVNSIAEGIVDTEMYQLNGKRVLLFVNRRSAQYKSLTVGFMNIDDNSGPAILESKVIESGVNSANSQQENFNNVGGNTQLAQKINRLDMDGTSVIHSVRLRLGGNVTNTFDIKLSIQAESAGNPSGTDLVSITVSSSVLKSINRDGDDVYFKFSSPYSLPTGDHFLVLTASSLAAMGSDSVYWYRTDGGNSLYANGEAKQYVSGAWGNADPSTSESWDFTIVGDRISAHWTDVASGNPQSSITSYPNNDLVSFLQKADNGMCYWFTGNKVHKLDGGTSGGRLGTTTMEVLVFPEYMKCVDAVDTNGLMYIGVQSAPQEGASTTKAFKSDVCGVYVWDRLTTAIRTRDFIPLVGVREIKKVYQTREGDIRCIVINNDRQVEIRSLSNSTFVIVQQLGVGAYPPYRDSLQVMNNHVQWLGYDGKIYAHGKPSPVDKEGLYIIGDATAWATGAFVAGIMAVGNEPASGQEQACYVSFTDAGVPKLVKWYPHGTGTINSVTQLANQGDVYTPVTYLPRLSTVRDIFIYLAPGTNNTTDNIGTVKVYFNQSATAAVTKSITKKDAALGYIQMDINKPYVNAVQFEIEWNTSLVMGTDDFTPSIAIVNYEPTNTHSPSKN